MNRQPQDPRNFRYLDVMRKGRPVHDPPDSFSIRHPPMPLSRRAKIFSPFDALSGFSEAIDNARRAHEAIMHEAGPHDDTPYDDAPHDDAPCDDAPCDDAPASARSTSV